jgi:hypothetical protein
MEDIGQSFLIKQMIEKVIEQTTHKTVKESNENLKILDGII